MLPGFRFLLAAIVLSTSMLVFGLGAAALLRAAHEQFASNPSWHAAPEATFAQQIENASPVLAMLHADPAVTEPTAPDNISGSNSGVISNSAAQAPNTALTNPTVTSTPDQPSITPVADGPAKLAALKPEQTSALDPSKSVWEEISGGADQIKLGDRTVNSRAYVAGFNFKGSDQQKPVAKLSGGERNRLHLAKLLRSGGNLLLLDEPTNDLDVDTLRALEEALLAFAGCAVVVSHDRWFLDRIATHVLAFEGDSQVRWFEGNFEAYESLRRAELGADADRPKRISYKKLVRG